MVKVGEIIKSLLKTFNMKENTQTILPDLHMLATDKIETETKIGYYRNVLSLNNSKYDKSLEVVNTLNGIHVPNPQHLYATTDQEIKSGWFLDWSVLNDNLVPTISQVLPSTDLTFLNHPTKKPYIKKIVATTNPELWKKLLGTEKLSGVPHYTNNFVDKIDTTFLQFYVDAYNAGKPIKQLNLLVEPI